MGVAEGNVGLAFGLVFAAGLSTTIGSAVALCANLTDFRVLAGALGCSAGVMLYVSFGEIFMVKGVEGFAESGYTDDEAMRYATFCFFAGILITAMLDKLVHFIASFGSQVPELNSAFEGSGHCCDPSRAEPAVADKQKQEASSGSTAGPDKLLPPGEQAVSAGDVEAGDKQLDAKKQRELRHMGLMTGLAIGLHNFPEGLATFVAALADAKLGGAIAIAIALHNIPEGVCVAMPVYYATGSRWKGFWWSFLSGVSEPIGGLFGYLILYGSAMSDLAYGVLFSIVAGMMVFICIKELIPTALKYDPEDKYVSNMVFVGMAVMAASLLAFTA